MSPLVKLPTVHSLPIKRPLVAVLVIVSLPAFPAQASPDATFPRGKPAAMSCPETPISSGGIPRTREYLETVLTCLDKAWAGYFRRAKREFRKPVVRYYEEPESTVCGVAWPEHAAAFYCTNRRTLVFPLTGRWIEDRTDLYPFKVAAHEYGHHLQSLLGIRRAFEERVRTRKPHREELKRRYELQADCLAGVFLGSVWRSLSRTRADWEELVEATRASGDDPDYRSHGRGANRAYWLERGYRAVSPAACDTWAAPAARVS